MHHQPTIFELARDGKIAELEKCPGDVNAKDGYNRTALSYAIRNNHENCVQYLVGARGANVDKYDGEGWTPIHLAVAHGHFGCLAYLIEQKANMNAVMFNYTPLSMAIFTRHMDCAGYLIQKGADVNGAPGVRSPLYRAIQKNELGMARLLLFHGADPIIEINSAQPTEEARQLILEARKKFKQTEE
jgi:ankyrin repeat protein